MVEKELKFGDDARSLMVNGINTLANAVKLTLGPRGNNVVIEQDSDEVIITKDGVTVAKSIKLENRYEQMGVQMVKEVASKTLDNAGDGTTTATVIAQAIVTEGMKVLASGMSAINVKRGIDKATEALIAELKKAAHPCTDREAIMSVASISANNDTEIGEMIADAVMATGANGVVTVKRGKSHEDELHLVEGMELEKGYVSPYFRNSETSSEALYEDAYVLVIKGKLSDLNEIGHLLNHFAEHRKTLIIIADDFEGTVIADLVSMHVKGKLHTIAIRNPGQGSNKDAIGEDIAIVTGGVVFGEGTGRELHEVTMEDLGNVDSINCGPKRTLLMGGKGKREDIDNRINALTELEKTYPHGYMRELTIKRRAKLAGGVAVLHVGGATELEIKEKRDRIEDSLFATRAAIEAGVVPGGGTALINAANQLHNFKTGDDEQDTGVRIMLRAAEQPLRQIAINAGMSPDVVVNNVMDLNEDGGYDALNDLYGNMFDMGILDPVKVTFTALSNAASVAGLVLTTGCIIVKTRPGVLDLD